MTKGTIQKKIDALIEQEEQLKVMFQKIQGAKEAYQALIVEMGETDDTADTKKKEKVKK